MSISIPKNGGMIPSRRSVPSKNNARQFVNVIVNFHSNKDLLTRIKKNCFNSVKKYNWEKVSFEYVRLYKKIIKETFFK